MSPFFASGDRSIEASASVAVLPVNIQFWFPLGFTSLISSLSRGLSRVFTNTTVQKHQVFSAQPSLWSTSHLYMTTGKTIALTRQTIVRKAMSLSFNTLSRFVVVFLPRSNHLLIRSNMKQVLPHETTEKMGILNETTLLDAGCQVAQNSDPWERGRKWGKPYSCPSLMPEEHLQATLQGGGPRPQIRKHVRGWEVAENPVARVFRVELQRGKRSTKRELHRSQELFPQVLSSTLNRAWWVWRNCLRIICLQCKSLGLIPGSGRSPGEGNGNPLQYSWLENSMDRGDWQVTVREVARVGHNLATKPPPHS